MWGRIGFDVGWNRCGACRAECARKSDSKKLTANDERFALAA
jgi:hypothetical protein